MNEEKARQETEAAQSGEETRALRGGPKEGVGSGEEEIIIKSAELLYLIALLSSESFEKLSSLPSPISPGLEARLLATRILYHVRKLGLVK